MAVNAGFGHVYTSRVQDSVNSGKGVFDPGRVAWEEDENGKVFIDGVRCRVIGNGHTELVPPGPPPIAPRSMRFKFYDTTIDPTQWEDVWNIGATWTKVEEGIYDWHYDSTEWAAKYSGSGASSGGNSALSTYRHNGGSNWANYLTNVDLDIIDSDLTGVTTVYQLFNVAHGVHHCSLKNTGSVQNWAGCFNNSIRNVRLESLNPLDMSSVDVTKFSASYAMFVGARFINSPIVLNLPNAVSLQYLFSGTNTSSSTLTLNLSSAFTGATATVLGTATFDEVTITGTTGMTSARYFNSSNVKKYTWTDWNTDGVDCTEMFRQCTHLTEVSLPANAKVTNAYRMFAYSGVASIPSLDLSSCTSTQRMCQDCSSLVTAQSLDLSSATDTSYMFGNCTSLSRVPSLTLPATTNTRYMFSGCTVVESGALDMYNYLSTKPVAVTTYNGTFNNCGSSADPSAPIHTEMAQIPTSWGGTGA